MKEDNQNTKEFDEVDLLDIKKAAVSLLDTVGFFMYKTGKYIAGKWVFITLGLLLGLILGYVRYNSHQKMLQTAEFSSAKGEVEYTLILAPKYNSIDYLDQLSLVKFSDQLGYTQIKASKLDGLDDIFSFVGQDSLYSKVFENLASKAESLGEAIHNYATSKNYPYQLLKIKAEQPFDIDKFIADLQTHFNEHPYFIKRKQIELGALTKEKEVLEEELKGIQGYAILLEKKGSNLEEQTRYIELLAKKKEILSRLRALEITQLESHEVLFVLDYITENPILTKDEPSIERQIAKDIVKFVLLFLIVGMGIDFVRYYKNRA
ncbi:hypothetical protein [Myroides odoratus]|uniref:Uncharacterized protein n=1 Tax=Myroides odoratus TaxID=256 RepID=A0A9Q7E7U5_MYROD|nr:hypothetical protein [Myroides odoratus]EHQ42508.1 hypothetical protein Myrod_1675 [Myroides odoratus DSM 2801]EKB07889.1 hypothetical protein HMPREF9716_01531 [Myroides odoratus CIP 103059]QQT99880.1 hypothetical protein I6I88_17215 [Myroides odoratus]WQD57905.1 hypothetical protein U0010_01735 [Myroides odoratus]STZ29770.1 Uncharacterised protein [Myroides odoratus]